MIIIDCDFDVRFPQIADVDTEMGEAVERRRCTRRSGRAFDLVAETVDHADCPR